ncbi:hypothetical protein [Tautonia rosea]|uniref:hypothetical protein n=1 Tax=Tautonia rosea TaxID=2728037 RepID=UPI0014729B24|nr:hypothetical protein [Tautonia rosea]
MTEPSNPYSPPTTHPRDDRDTVGRRSSRLGLVLAVPLALAALALFGFFGFGLMLFVSAELEGFGIISHPDAAGIMLMGSFAILGVMSLLFAVAARSCLHMRWRRAATMFILSLALTIAFFYCLVLVGSFST